MYPFTFTLLINLWSIYPFILLNQSIHPSTHPSIHTPFHASIYIPFHLLFTHSFTKPSIYLYTQTPFFGYCCCSVAKSYLTLWPRVLHPSEGANSPRVCSNSCPLNQWCHPTISCSITLSPLALSLSHHQVFSSESALCIKWPKYWSFSFNTSPANEYSGLISFRINWFDLLVVQGTLKSSPTLQFKSINFLALSFLYGPTLTSILDYWKNHSFD